MSEDIFTLNAQVQAVIERAKEDAKMLRDGSFRDNAMQVIVELDSRLKQAQQREQAAYERGKAEERARIVAALEAERNDRLQRMEQEREEEDEERASYYFGLARELGLAIEIVNQE